MMPNSMSSGGYLPMLKQYPIGLCLDHKIIWPNPRASFGVFLLQQPQAAPYMQQISVE
jgi:hypothetical protein